LTNVYPKKKNKNKNKNNKVKSKPLELYELAGKNNQVFSAPPENKKTKFIGNDNKSCRPVAEVTETFLHMHHGQLCKCTYLYVTVGPKC
jgi:hypothetical protein